MTSLPDSKECSKCHAIKPRTEFYTRGKSNPYHTSECKDCMKLRSKKQPKRDRHVSGVKSEAAAIQHLLENGMPALPGKALGHKWCDIVIWGAILCECKASNLVDGQFFFTFSSAQRHERLRGEFIICICDWGDHKDYYIFPAKHPMFYNKNGKLKTGFGWTPNRSHVGRPSAISEGERESYREAWHLVETRRIEIVQQLREKKIIALPIAA